jgi:hypothetical protein
MTVTKEMSEYKLDLMGEQEVRWDRGGTEPVDNYTVFYGKGNAASLPECRAKLCRKDTREIL